MDRSKFYKNPNPLRENYRPFTIALCLFSYLIVICIVILNDGSNIYKDIVNPIVISFIVIIIIGIHIDIVLKKMENKSRKKNNIIYENPSQNMYPINPRYFQTGLTDEQYERLKSFRISNALIFIFITLFMSLLIIDFNSHYIIKDIILPFFMILGACGIVFVIDDFIAEKAIRLFFRKHKTSNKPPKNKKINFLTKNKRIYYIPICFILCIIELIIVVDFDTAHIWKKIVFPTTIILLINIVGMTILELIINHITKIRNIMYEENTKEGTDKNEI